MREIDFSTVYVLGFLIVLAFIPSFLVALRVRKLFKSAGLPWDLDTCKRRLQEGLVVFCPWLASKDSDSASQGSDADASVAMDLLASHSDDVRMPRSLENTFEKKPPPGMKAIRA
jgi:hypothetical protein